MRTLRSENHISSMIASQKISVHDIQSGSDIDIEPGTDTESGADIEIFMS